jgi:hypothetical protein
MRSTSARSVSERAWKPIAAIGVALVAVAATVIGGGLTAVAADRLSPAVTDATGSF